MAQRVAATLIIALGLLLAWGGLARGAPAPPADVQYPLTEGFEGGTLGAFQSVVPTCAGGGCGWRVVAGTVHTGGDAAFAPAAPNSADQQLALVNPIAIPADATAATLTFWHAYRFVQPDRDGGVLEISADGGASWQDAGAQITGGGYTGPITSCCRNPLAGRQGWIGQSPGYPAYTLVTVNLLPDAGQGILFRFRQGDGDGGSGGVGWYVDDVQVSISAPAACTPGAWTAGPAYPLPILYNAVVSLDGVLYSFGGITNGQETGAAYRLVPGGSWQPIAPLPGPRDSASTVTDGNAIYILGGYDGQAFRNTLWRYDPAADSYTTLAPSAIATSGQAAAYLNGTIYKIGGYGGSFTRGVEGYVISTDTWVLAPQYPFAGDYITAAAWGGVLFTAGGNVSGGAGATTKTYRFDGTTWDDGAVADLPAPRDGAAAAFYNGQWLLAGGQAGTAVLASVLAWDPAANTWHGLPALPLPRARGGGAGLDGSFYVVGGEATVGDLTGTTDTQVYQAVPCTPFTPSPSPTPTACATHFSDVGPAQYFYTPVLYLACRGVISGYADGTFRPYNDTTRAQQVKIAVLGLGVPAVTPAPRSYTFADVRPDAPFFAVVETAAGHGIAGGYACGGPAEPCDPAHRPYFRPNTAVTRGQLAKIVVAAAGWSLVSPAQATFADVPSGAPFYPFVETAACRGVISGYGCGGPGEPCDPQQHPYFRPGAVATRGQIAKIVYLALTAGSGCAPATPPAGKPSAGHP